MYKNCLVIKLGKFQIYDVVNWKTDNYDAHIAQYLKMQG